MTSFEADSTASDVDAMIELATSTGVGTTSNDGGGNNVDYGYLARQLSEAQEASTNNSKKTENDDLRSRMTGHDIERTRGLSRAGTIDLPKESQNSESGTVG